MAVSKELDCDLDNEEGQQNVVDDIVYITKHLHLLNLLSQS